MGQIQFWNDQILFVDGQIAMDPACCCVSNPDCTGCTGYKPAHITCDVAGFTHLETSPWNGAGYVLDPYDLVSGWWDSCTYYFHLGSGYYLVAQAFFGLSGLPDWNDAAFSGKGYWACWITFGPTGAPIWGATSALSGAMLPCDPTSSITANQNRVDHIFSAPDDENGISFLVY